MSPEPTPLAYSGTDDQTEFHNLARVEEGLRKFWPQSLVDRGQDFETASEEVLGRVREKMEMWIKKLKVWQIDNYFLGQVDGKLHFCFEGPVTSITGGDVGNDIFVTSDDIQPINPEANDFYGCAVSITFDHTSGEWDFGERLKHPEVSLGTHNKIEITGIYRAKDLSPAPALPLAEA
ncbi:hypothetical protein HN748_04055 [Candidatus Peregrinibacteria bacterium]|jgi:hypothetical protein|nr:hypothetical protein [Candidatus Peregrinibacteria bacterium]MBT7484477.1 hypothetical protein [Candidatus Peregrinibacteria bacterium]MBT7703383.1 hypothetical protein [Candidatus Peregrinibacteria bacterium]